VRLRGPLMPKRPATWLTRAERDDLLAIATDPRDRAILHLYCFAALRRNELKMLDRADIDPRARTVHVRHGKGGKQRSVPLNRRTLAALAEWEAARTDASPILFPGARGGRIGNTTLWRILDRHTAGLDLGKRIRLHSLRHTAITAVYNAEKDIVMAQQFAGHSDPRTTVRYTHVAEEALRRAIEGQ
jgi:integrase